MKTVLLFLALFMATPAFVGCSNDEGSGSNTGTSKGSHKGHEWVDLGIGVKWATCNIGASTPEEHGDYFAWGEPTPKSSYTVENSKTHERAIESIVGDPSYDAACAIWGGGWRMPNINDLNCLIDNCTWISCIQEGHEGFKITGPNGNSIFLPATVYCSGTDNQEAEIAGYYWTSSLIYSRYNSHPVLLDQAYSLVFTKSWYESRGTSRWMGLTIRPVLD